MYVRMHTHITHTHNTHTHTQHTHTHLFILTVAFANEIGQGTLNGSENMVTAMGTESRPSMSKPRLVDAYFSGD